MENKNMNEIEMENVTGGAAYGDNYYVVKRGDTLGAIASRYHTTVNHHNCYLLFYFKTCCVLVYISLYG